MLVEQPAADLAAAHAASPVAADSTAEAVVDSMAAEAADAGNFRS